MGVAPSPPPGHAPERDAAARIVSAAHLPAPSRRGGSNQGLVSERRGEHRGREPACQSWVGAPARYAQARLFGHAVVERATEEGDLRAHARMCMYTTSSAPVRRLWQEMASAREMACRGRWHLPAGQQAGSRARQLGELPARACARRWPPIAGATCASWRPSSQTHHTSPPGTRRRMADAPWTGIETEAARPTHAPRRSSSPFGHSSARPPPLHPPRPAHHRQGSRQSRGLGVAADPGRERRAPPPEARGSSSRDAASSC